MMDGQGRIVGDAVLLLHRPANPPGSVQVGPHGLDHVHRHGRLEQAPAIARHPLGERGHVQRQVQTIVTIDLDG